MAENDTQAPAEEVDEESAVLEELETALEVIDQIVDRVGELTIQVEALTRQLIAKDIVTPEALEVAERNIAAEFEAQAKEEENG